MLFKGTVRPTAVLILTIAAAGAFAPAQANGSVCVARDRHCFHDLQAAVDAAPTGGTIRVDPGTYAGGVVVSRSVRIVGAGADRTVVRGGNSVLTVHTSDPAHRPVVLLRDLSLTGGVSHGDNDPNDAGLIAVGGGLDIERGPNSTVGADVTLVRVTVRGNRTEPTRTVDSSNATCPSGPCPFAFSAGGGVFSGGDLTLLDSVVAGNSAAGPSSDAAGGGVFSNAGTVTVRRSRISDNTSRPSGIGRFAEGGGLMVEGGGPVLVRDSMVTRNAAVLSTTYPAGIDMNANSGGIHLGNQVSGATVLDSRISDNRVVVDAPNGDAAGFDSAVLAYQLPLTVRRSQITGNSVRVEVATSDASGLSGSTLEFDGPGEVTDTTISDNSVYAHSADGSAQASNGLTVFNFLDGAAQQVTARRLRITGNTARAVSENGSALTTGAGVINNGLLDLADALVKDNTATAFAPTATAQGGGIWNGVLLSGPPVTLKLRRDQVVENVVRTGAGGTAQGGGLYTSEPVALVQTLVARNRPDQVYDASTGARRALLSPAARPRSRSSRR